MPHQLERRQRAPATAPPKPPPPPSLFIDPPSDLATAPPTPFPLSSTCSPSFSSDETQPPPSFSPSFASTLVSHTMRAPSDLLALASAHLPHPSPPLGRRLQSPPRPDQLDSRYPLSHLRLPPRQRLVQAPTTCRPEPTAQPPTSRASSYLEIHPDQPPSPPSSASTSRSSTTPSPSTPPQLLHHLFPSPMTP